MNPRKNYFTLLTATVLASLVFMASTSSATSQENDQDNAIQKDLEDLKKRFATMKPDKEAIKLTQKALKQLTKEQDKPQITPRVEKSGLDLGAFTKRYRLDQGTMKNALEQPATFYAFVSFSMDLKAMREIGRDVGKVGGTLVLRGLVNNSLQETQAKILELQNVSTSLANSTDIQGDVAVNMVIDPTLFETYSVSNVPTFVVTEKLEGCIESGCDEKRPPYDKLSGLVTVEYALQQLSEKGAEASKHAAQLLRNLKGQE